MLRWGGPDRPGERGIILADPVRQQGVSGQYMRGLCERGRGKRAAWPEAAVQISELRQPTHAMKSAVGEALNQQRGNARSGLSDKACVDRCVMTTAR